MRRIPIKDDAYFTLGVDNSVLQEIHLYSGEEYERLYPEIITVLPVTFSINLYSAINDFITSRHPAFEVNIDEVIELACYYYCDWDSVVAVTDEVIRPSNLDALRKSFLSDSFTDPESLVQEQITMLSEALKRFLGVLIGVLANVGAPAIMDYGCSYRLSNLTDCGDVYFTLSNPTQVLGTLEY